MIQLRGGDEAPASSTGTGREARHHLSSGAMLFARNDLIMLIMANAWHKSGVIPTEARILPLIGISPGHHRRNL